MASMAHTEYCLAFLAGCLIKQINSRQTLWCLDTGSSGNGGKQVNGMSKVRRALGFHLAWPLDHDRRADTIFIRAAFRPLSVATPQLLIRVIRVAAWGRPTVVTDIKHKRVVSQATLLKNF